MLKMVKEKTGKVKESHALNISHNFLNTLLPKSLARFTNELPPSCTSFHFNILSIKYL